MTYQRHVAYLLPLLSTIALAIAGCDGKPTDPTDSGNTQPCATVTGVDVDSGYAGTRRVLYAAPLPLGTDVAIEFSKDGTSKAYLTMTSLDGSVPFTVPDIEPGEYEICLRYPCTGTTERCRRFKVLRRSIDYMDVDDSAEVLTIRGTFGAGTPSVTIDGESVEVQTNRSTQHRIVVRLPRSGKGSCGDVIVKVGGKEYGPRRLYAWNGTLSTYLTTRSSQSLAGANVRIRADIGPRPNGPRSLANRDIAITGWNISGVEQEDGCYHEYTVIARPTIPWRDADDSAGAATGVGVASEFFSSTGNWTHIDQVMLWGWVTVKDAVRVKFDPKCSSGETVVGGFSINFVGERATIDPVTKMIVGGSTYSRDRTVRTEWTHFICENP